MAKKNKIPEVRFKGFTEDWEQCDLSQIIDLQSGRDYKHLKKGNIPVYGTGGYMLSVNEALSNKDSIGIGRKGTIDKPYILNAPFWTVDTLFYAVPKNKNDLQFLNCIFKNINWKYKDESTGVPSLSKVTINSVQTYTTKPNEQKQIGSFFQNLDNLITLHQKKYDKLVILKKAMLVKMFPKNGATVPEIRFKGFTEDWEEEKLSYFVDKAVDNRGKTPPLNKNGNHPLIEVDALGNGAPVYSKISKFLDNYSFNNFLRDHIRKGDILFSTVGSIGLVSIMDDNKNAAIAQNIVAFRAKEGFIPEYLYSLFSNNVNKSLAYRIVMRGVQPSIKVSQLVNVRYFITTNKDEQWKIGEYFKNLDKQIALHKKQLKKLKNIKKACLTKMFVAQD